jgi:hypothetical protein
MMLQLLVNKPLDGGGSRDERVLLILRVLDHPLIQGETRATLVKSLQPLAGPSHDFKGRYWDAVAWAEAEAAAGRLPGYPPPSLFR